VMGEFDGVPGIATFGGQGGKSDGMGTEGVTESRCSYGVTLSWSIYTR
jgi:hypothetical protein